MICPICEKTATNYTQGNFYSKSMVLSTPIFYCKGCNTFIRDIDNDSLLSYFKKSVYTDINYEERTYNNRIKFFEYLYTLTKRHNNSILNWLDYGCSYGHFIAFLNEKRIRSYGIEISDEARDYANSKGLSIYKKLDDLPQKMTFNVVSLIDSLYYSSTPRVLLKQVYETLEDNGLLILRIVNRNWLVKFDKHFLHKKTCTALIEHTIGYSKKSILYLLNKSGFKILETTNIEKGKYRSTRVKYFYFLTIFLNIISRGLIYLSPGVILIARKIPTHNKA
jgi:SAM-dependent methyltransferase